MSKIIQTFWLPNTPKEGLLNEGGFVCPEIHYMSWALSCLQLLKFYPCVELHTNKAGKEILIDVLGLPYTQVHLSLETEFINNLLPCMWAYCKIHTYSLQKEPFLHIDGDVFIWKPFDVALMQSPLIVQNIDEDLQVYKDCLDILEKQASYKPEWMLLPESPIRAYNAGIIGGSNIAFFKEYTDLAFEFYDKNKSQFDAMQKDNKHIHIIPEQYFPYVLSKKNNVKAMVQNDKIVSRGNNEFAHFFEIDKIPFDESYMHVLGNIKKSKMHNDFVNFVLKQEHPEYWQKIIAVFEEKDILSPYMKRQMQMQSDTQEIVLPQTPNPTEDYKHTTFISKLFDLDFEKDKEAVVNNPKLNDLYTFESQIIEFNQKLFLKKNYRTNPFPNYKTETEIFKQKDFEDYYISINPYHEICTTKLEWSKHLATTNKVEIEEMNPFKSVVLLYLDMNYFSNHSVWLNDSVFHFFEKLKASPTKIGELLKSEELQLQDDTDNNVLVLLKKWYSHGMIYLSKSDCIPQESSRIYEEQQINIKKQIGSCLHYIVNFYKVEDYNPLLISQFDAPQKITSLQEIIKVLQELNFEANGVRGTINNLSAITTPAIAQLKLRNYLNLYAIITKVTDNEVTIFNTEIMEEESYSKDYFSTIWNGILILVSPKTPISSHKILDHAKF
jgi:hypothetical protein